jgi:hypothetical protein
MDYKIIQSDRKPCPQKNSRYSLKNSQNSHSKHIKRSHDKDHPNNSSHYISQRTPFQNPKQLFLFLNISAFIKALVVIFVNFYKINIIIQRWGTYEQNIVFLRSNNNKSNFFLRIQAPTLTDPVKGA